MIRRHCRGTRSHSRSLSKIGRRSAARMTTGQGRRPMTVKTILSTKGSDVVTIEPTATLEAAIASLAARRIGAIVVLGADRRVIGIVSERDIVRAISARGERRGRGKSARPRRARSRAPSVPPRPSFRARASGAHASPIGASRRSSRPRFASRNILSSAATCRDATLGRRSVSTAEPAREGPA